MQPQRHVQPADDEQLLTFWQTELQRSTDKPWLASLLLRRGTAINRRFNHYYERLRSLPRAWRRAISRKLLMGMAGAAMLLALSGGAAPRVFAANIVVNGTTCTLSDAITAANSDAPSGGCTAGSSGADTIDLRTDVLLSSALPDIHSLITLQGNGHTIERDVSASTPDFSVLSVAASGDLTLNDAVISGGYSYTSGGGVSVVGGTLTVNGSTISSNSAYEGGGGIGSYGGNVTVNSSTISGNIAYATRGGGIDNFGGDVTVNDSTVSGNQVFNGFGGGIAAYSGSLTIENSTVSGNEAHGTPPGGAGSGGGIGAVYSMTTVTAATISANKAATGGGVWMYDNSTLQVNESIISGNSAVNGGSGGGISIDLYSQATIEDSTVSGNEALGAAVTYYAGGGGGKGGGIESLDSQLTIKNSTISENKAHMGFKNEPDFLESGEGGGIDSKGSIVALDNSTVSGNGAVGDPSPYYSGGLGGGLSSTYDEITINNSTISANYAGGEGGGVRALGSILTFNRSIISGNNAASEAEVSSAAYGGGTLLANNFNLFGYNNDAGTGGFTPGPADIIPSAGIFLADILAPLNNNGGPTATHALVPGGPALDVVPNGAGGLVDQRGAARDADGDGLGDLSGTEGDSGAFELQADEVQTVALAAGWNLISTHMQPYDPSPAALLAGIQDDMVLIKNGAGQVYWPAYGIDQIGNWQADEGYQIYMNSPLPLAVYGSRIDPAISPIELAAGWNMVAYLRSSPMPVAAALGSISDDLYLVKDGYGRIYWPAMGITNDLLDMVPGQAYQIYMNDPAVLTYPGN